MNSLTLSSSSPRWWWPSATAAAVALAAVGAITVGPGLFADTVADTDAPAEPGLSFVAPVRSCIHGQPNWNPALDGGPLACREVARGSAAPSVPTGPVRNPARELPLP
jgi:hypothetical protein